MYKNNMKFANKNLKIFKKKLPKNSKNTIFSKYVKLYVCYFK